MLISSVSSCGSRGWKKNGHKNGQEFKNGQELLVVHLEIFETDVGINPFCYEKILEEIRRKFLTMRQLV